MINLVRSMVQSDQINAIYGGYMLPHRLAAHALAEDVASTFQGALDKLASFVGAKEVGRQEMTISEFKAKYASVLNRTDSGSLQVIKRNSRRYVILDEAQIMALTENTHSSLSAGALLADLRLPSANGNTPRSRLSASGLARAGRLPE